MSTQSIKTVMEVRAPDIVDYNDSGVDARLTSLIALAELQTDVNAFPTNYDLAVALRVLHWLTMESRGGAGGTVVSETEGKVSRKYGGLMDASGDLSSTSYGLELIQLQRQNVAPFITRMSGLPRG